MKWGLSQGIIGRERDSLTPSALAVGPNTYLSQLDFLKMLGIACFVHFIVLLVTSLMPNEKVKNIPVRALSFKLGDSSRVSSAGLAKPAAPPVITPPAPVMSSTKRETWQASPSKPAPQLPTPLRPIAPPAPVPLPMKAPKVIPIQEPAARQIPAENAPPVLAPIPTTAPAPPVIPPAAPAAPPLAELPPASLPAVASSPQQYVREVGAAAPVESSAPRGIAQAAQAIRERYEQQISAWVSRHKQYPVEAAGREGRVVVRMRIDRTGYVRYYAIEQGSGISAIDMAALDMIRRANPMPAVPENYPAGNLIEFLIPISFRAP
jgi:protein TonB